VDAKTPGFSLFLPQMRMSIDAIVERAVAAEAAGFEGVAFMDHLAPPLAFEHEMWDAITLAAWVLARTTTLRVGHLVLCDAFRHPAVLARQVTSLDHASGGRFELGIGWGSVPSEFEVFGIGSAEPSARVARLGESLEIMRRLWAGEVVDFQGDYFTLAGAQQRPVPLGPIPITIGGVGKRTLALVREHADWWNIPVQHLEKLDELRREAGEARVSYQPMVAFVPDDTKRREISDVAERRFGGTGMGKQLVIGTAPELVEHFESLHATGVDRFYVWFADFAPVETLHGFSDVIAGCQKRAGRSVR
jgi:alkanesulfonate monooxygenase SsuD/methylene tetrahydromethanopterin reductase-like flavin-dependent oxidoreductase (luciferase family)